MVTVKEVTVTVLTVTEVTVGVGTVTKVILKVVSVGAREGIKMDELAR